MTYESGLYTRSDEYGTPYIVICITTITLFYHTYIPNVSLCAAFYFRILYSSLFFIKGFF